MFQGQLDFAVVVAPLSGGPPHAYDRDSPAPPGSGVWTVPLHRLGPPPSTVSHEPMSPPMSPCICVPVERCVGA
ncbi:hypothetical protein BO71DRAFT_428372 [Aspergillus ellipticus CBS 707.79]|uniref:Uncharacterized protein n=1 Tax=Aspergillus ellipticus CBS 707.79 TaxID=1448320 RepID=A0A319DGA0_9EURO|nr:hypothetical protein BO71DRAFT_428372 [Aspergillus ellipticus CBS 707.79]